MFFEAAVDVHDLADRNKRIFVVSKDRLVDVVQIRVVDNRDQHGFFLVPVGTFDVVDDRDAAVHLLLDAFDDVLRLRRDDHDLEFFVAVVDNVDDLAVDEDVERRVECADPAEDKARDDHDDQVDRDVDLAKRGPGIFTDDDADDVEPAGGNPASQADPGAGPVDGGPEDRTQQRVDVAQSEVGGRKPVHHDRP